MARFSYIRPTKLHPEPEQRAALAGISFDEEYHDAKPRRGDPGWFWWEKLVHACRPGEGDEVHVSHASVIADSVPIALKKLGDLAARGAVLVVASTGKRYTWHPDAADALKLALEMEREARREVARRGGEGQARKAQERRKREARKLAEAKRLWLDRSILVEEVYAKTGMTRHELYKLFGPSGRPRFGRGA
jgi:hypothetical protein